MLVRLLQLALIYDAKRNMEEGSAITNFNPACEPPRARSPRCQRES
jgi:hypothetical protein